MRKNLSEQGSPCQACGQHHDPNIHQLIHNLFDWQQSSAIQSELWDWYQTALSSPDMDNWSAIERSNLAHFYKQMSLFLNQLDIIHQTTIIN